MKKRNLALTSILMGCCALASASTNYKPPINQYGAVNVNANVPTSTQVTPKPQGFQDPKINQLATNWSDMVPSPPALAVKSYILMSADTGQVIAAYNANKRLPPASITKLMLLYIAEQELQNGSINLSDTVQVPKIAWATGGSRMFLKPGDSVTVAQLIPGIVVDSGNDAAVSLATHIAGTQEAFVDIMNQQAQHLGMTNTHFTDVMGLPAPAHYSSARDLAVLARAMVTQYPQNQSWFSQKTYSYDGIKQYNYNKLLFIYPYADGLKTGSTDSAGYSLVSTAKQPNNNMRLIAVVLNAPKLMASATDSKALLTYGFRFFKEQNLYPANKTLQELRVYGGENRAVPVGLAKPLSITIPSYSTQKITSTISVDNNLNAPIKSMQQVGDITVKFGNQVIASAPLVSLSNDPKGGWFRSLYDYIAKKA